MLANHAAKIIDAMVDSLKENPTQFQFNVNVSATGLRATAQGGGIGAMGIAQGGGTGIHASVSMNDSQIQIAQKRGEASIQEEYQALLRTLAAIAEELRAESPDRSKLKQMYEALKGKWIPGVITSVVGNLITLVVLS